MELNMEGQDYYQNGNHIISIYLYHRQHPCYRQAQSSLETLYSRYVRDKLGWRRAAECQLRPAYLLDQVILASDWSTAAIPASDWLASCRRAW